VIRLSGWCAAVMVAIAPVLVFPDLHVFEAGAVVAVLCVAAVLVPSLALAVVGSITALLVFATPLLLTHTAYALFAALLLGIGVLMLFDATHFESRFARSEGRAWIISNHLASLGAAVLLSLITALVTTVGVSMASQELDLLVRTGLVAFGGILVIASLMWKALQ
jgi:hypothetical protein